mmetsp:Transcript_21329/g.47681  ORF Transcript_21329/g.47681 Transcript_21329/m.47681 type:complete len:201 (-) Transcript_21329:789-1391(-)
MLALLALLVVADRPPCTVFLSSSPHGSPSPPLSLLSRFASSTSRSRGKLPNPAAACPIGSSSKSKLAALALPLLIDLCSFCASAYCSALTSVSKARARAWGETGNCAWGGASAAPPAPAPAVAVLEISAAAALALLSKPMQSSSSVFTKRHRVSGCLAASLSSWSLIRRLLAIPLNCMSSYTKYTVSHTLILAAAKSRWE